MRLSTLLLTLARFLLTPVLLGAVYIYLYPVIQFCHFPDAQPGQAACHFGDTPQPAVAATKAPFRLLALADPQLEGDTSLPGKDEVLFPSLEGWRRRRDRRVEELTTVVQDVVRKDVPALLQGYRKKLDLWGNDRYLAHVFRSVSWWTKPTHVVVLGDLLGSQWIGDDEFERRSGRFWETVVPGTEKVDKDLTDGKVEVLGQDGDWKKRVITVAGNHDIGYAGDIDARRIERFERQFGPVNWQIRFTLNESSPNAPTLSLVILNSMNLDSPAADGPLQDQTLQFLEETLLDPPSHRHHGTILLTHIPLHKPAGTCPDAPFTAYFGGHGGHGGHGGGIKEQNHLSPEVSTAILSSLMTEDGQHPAGIILNGHDHSGCDVFHYRKQDSPSTWLSQVRTLTRSPPVLHPRTPQNRHHDSPSTPRPKPSVNKPAEPSLREITVKSMMGSYGGNAGLLSAWFDEREGEWRFEYASCAFSVQHFWWAVHVAVLVEVWLFLGGLGMVVLEERRDEERRMREVARGKKEL